MTTQEAELKETPAPTTIEIRETPVAEAPIASSTPSAADLKKEGWSDSEIESATKKGLIGKDEVKEVVKEPIKEVVKEEKVVEKKATGGLPDLGEMTPEKEAAFLAAFGPGTPQHGLYFSMKRERLNRQKAELRMKELEAKLSALEAAKNQPEKDPLAIAVLEDQPLTIKALREMREAEQRELDERNQAQNERGSIIKEAQTHQEEYARTIYKDFDTTVELTKEVLQNLDQLVPEKRSQTRVLKLVRDLQIAAANAEKFQLDDDHAAMIAYEIGKFHPKYGKAAEKAEETGLKDPKANGGLSAEAMKRIEANNLRRVSSAAIPAGGGKRTISVDDVTEQILADMNLAERTSFKKNHPDAYAQLLRG